MDAFQLARLGQFRQVAADGLERNTELFGQTFDRDLPLPAGGFEDIGMAEGLRQWSSPLWAGPAQDSAARALFVIVRFTAGGPKIK